MSLKIHKLFQRALEKYKKEGIIPLLSSGFRYTYKQGIRKYLPPVSYPIIQDVEIYIPDKRLRVLDKIVLGEDFHFDKNHKKSNVSLIQKYILPGDEVVVVGGGRGITSVNAARQVGTGGSIVVYEAAKSQISKLKETIKLNDVEHVVSIRHAVVGEALSTLDSIQNAPTLSAEDLPECDVLEMDCEGGEIHILDNLGINPECIIVETHPRQNADTRKIGRILKTMGFEIVESKPDRNSGDVIVGKISREETET
jgi:hypothetical protein